MTLTDDIRIDQNPVIGEVSIRPFDRDGKTLSDPWAIFANPSEVKTSQNVKAFEDTALIYLDHNLVVNLGRQTIA